jgi:hypothetical protein
MALCPGSDVRNLTPSRDKRMFYKFRFWIIKVSIYFQLLYNTKKDQWRKPPISSDVIFEYSMM